jgi:F-box interacting protein
LDHRAGVAAADKLHSVALLGKGDTYMEPKASCDGLVILTIATDSSISDVWQFTVCNPATRQYAPLPLLRGFNLAEMYRHPPTCEYRLLLYPDAMLGDDDRPLDVQDACYVYALGSCQPPRHIGWPEVEVVIHAIVPAFFRGCLHWFLEQDEFENSKIMVFDTVAELFRQMRAPAIPGAADLFEMDGMLGMASFLEEVTTIDIWTIQDYDSEIWALKYRVDVPAADLLVRSGFSKYYSDVVVLSWDNDLLILAQSGEWLHQFDITGNLVSSFHRKFLRGTQFRLKQTLVQHSFFPTIEGYVVNTWPFISRDDSAVKV